MPSARWLIHQAAAVYDSDAHAGLRQRSKKAGTAGFSSGGQWMALAMASLRGSPVAERPELPFQNMGITKYALSLGMGVLLGGACFQRGLWAGLLGFVVGFYGMESPHVFLFPAAIDGAADPWARARALAVQGGFVETFRCVICLAVVMLAGGFLGQGFVRSWCLGCLAVVIWYEHSIEWERCPVTNEPGACPVLSFGNAGLLLLRTEIVHNLPLGQRVAYLTDLHWTGHSQPAREALIRVVTNQVPDFILLGGDYADTKAGMAEFSAFLADCVRICPVAGILGNHDHWVGEEAVRSVFSQHGAGLVPEGSLKMHHPLLSGLSLVHEPEAARSLQGANELILAGHLHGCQVTLWNEGPVSYPGAWVYPLNTTKQTLRDHTLIVSRRLGDTLPVRWNTPHEIILLNGSSKA